MFTCVQFGDLLSDFDSATAAAADAFARDPRVYFTALAVIAVNGSASAAAAVLPVAHVEVD